MRHYHRTQQYSITALTDSNGNVTERYAYTGYGTPTITDSAGATLTSSADNNRYTYTGREWDETLNLYHFRARMYDLKSGRFMGRDPIGYADSINAFQFLRSQPASHKDPYGLSTVIGVVQPPPGSSTRCSIHRLNDGRCVTRCLDGTISQIPCPRTPENDPQGPSFQEGIDGLIAGHKMLQGVCVTVAQWVAAVALQNASPRQLKLFSA